jgi:hypothetical protein
MALNFPDTPVDGEVYENYQWDDTAGVWNLVPSLVQARYVISPTAPLSPQDGDAWFNSTDGVTYIYYVDVDSGQWVQTGDPALGYLTLGALSDTDITTPTAGEKLVFDGTNWVNLEGYVYVDTVYFTSSGTFAKADYPWLRAVRVKVQGAGGGGGNRLSLTEASAGGAGGGYAESFITDISGLDASVTVTVGAGGSGGASGASNNGTTGGASSFGTAVVGNGGNSSAGGGSRGGTGVGGTGDVVFFGADGGSGDLSRNSPGGTGGSSHLGGGGQGGRGGGGDFAEPGRLYGGAGGGSVGNFGGKDGAAGIVIVELYA